LKGKLTLLHDGNKENGWLSDDIGKGWIGRMYLE